MDLFRVLRKKEDDLLARIVNYTILVSKTVEKLKELVEFLIKKEEKRKITSIFSEIDMLETEADEVRRKLTEEIAAGSFFSYLREDFLLLLETIDDIADSAKDASKILIESKLNEESILFLFHNSGGIRYVDFLLNTVRMLIKCLESLRKVPPKKLISLVRSVELSEEDADKMKTELMKSLYEKTKELSILDIISLKDFLNVVDNIADKAEDSSDIILRMVAKGYA
ncbi:MAG: hypothetical protein DRG31_07265 [Deltaproteobacteria bacterium]|nr:MAG: hypothetical protein DRG31_07265 [Deltaproteobacteria bacterium]